MIKVNYITISWQQIKLFLECPACFYAVFVLREKRPGIDPEAFSLHRALDEGMKADFDKCREKQLSHPEMLKNNIDAIPFQHALLSNWRNYKAGGIRLNVSERISLKGVVDDVWITPQGELVIVEYKGTSKSYLADKLIVNDKYDWLHVIQLSFYGYLFMGNGFSVAKNGYVVYGNAVKNSQEIGEPLNFDIEYHFVQEALDFNVIEKVLHDMFTCLKGTKLPVPSEECEHCRWLKSRTLVVQFGRV